MVLQRCPDSSKLMLCPDSHKLQLCGGPCPCEPLQWGPCDQFGGATTYIEVTLADHYPCPGVWLDQDINGSWCVPWVYTGQGSPYFHWMFYLFSPVPDYAYVLKIADWHYGPNVSGEVFICVALQEGPEYAVGTVWHETTSGNGLWKWTPKEHIWGPEPKRCTGIYHLFEHNEEECDGHPGIGSFGGTLTLDVCKSAGYNPCYECHPYMGPRAVRFTSSGVVNCGCFENWLTDSVIISGSLNGSWVLDMKGACTGSRKVAVARITQYSEIGCGGFVGSYEQDIYAFLMLSKDAVYAFLGTLGPGPEYWAHNTYYPEPVDCLAPRVLDSVYPPCSLVNWGGGGTVTLGPIE